MEAVSQKIAEVKAAVLGSEGTPGNEEPPSGVTGQGTVDSPYDQGNAPEQPAHSHNEETPSGVTGKGTVGSPYDQGNAPEQTADPSNVVSSGEPVGITTSSADKTQPPAIQESSSTPSVPTQPTLQESTTSTSTTNVGSGNPMSAPTPQQEQATTESRGRDETSQRTTSTMLSPNDAKNSGNFDAAKTTGRFERSVSPGQLADGTHVRCSGDRGESYNPGNKFADKLKDKFHFGHKK